MKVDGSSQNFNLWMLERRESQLWWLAVIIIVLLACALSAMDWVSALSLRSTHPLSIALNTKFMRIALILSVLTISAYFRESVRRLRRTNKQLIDDLLDRTHQLQRKNDETRKLKDLSEELIALTDIPNALNLALDIAVEVIGADSASIMLRESGSDILKVVAARGLSAEVVRHTEVKLGDALSGMVAATGQAVILNSDDLDGNLKFRATKLSELVSSLIVPIRVESEVRGVINVSKQRGGKCFTEDDLSVLSTLANQSALVLQKIELWEDLQEQVVKLENALIELRQTQAELVQSEKLASIGQLAGGIAHEINNPLQVILGRVELLLQQTPTDSPQANHMRSMLEHTERIAAIVSSLLRYARRQPEEENDQVTLDDAVRDAARLLENQLNLDNVQLIMDLSSPNAIVTGSRVKIQQVFMNLLINAHQATRSTGGQLRVASTLESGQVIVTVSDTGAGIPEDHLSRIFEPFFTTKTEGEGTGLGLFVTYGIVESHGGRIEVESQVGRGTTFTVTFPLGKALPKAA